MAKRVPKARYGDVGANLDRKDPSVPQGETGQPGPEGPSRCRKAILVLPDRKEPRVVEANLVRRVRKAIQVLSGLRAQQGQRGEKGDTGSQR